MHLIGVIVLSVLFWWFVGSMFKSDADRAVDEDIRRERRERRRNREPILNRILRIRVNPPRS
jgi:hypothetical protein